MLGWRRGAGGWPCSWAAESIGESAPIPTPGTFTAYAINLGAVSGVDGNVRSNQVTVHVR